MTRSIYKARAKRIFFNIFVAIFIAALFGLTLYYSVVNYMAGWYWLATVCLACSVLLLSLYGVALSETQSAIKRRGYSRPIGTSKMERVVKSIFQLPASEFDKSHPSEYQRSRKTVYFDDGSTYDVDLGKFYFVLLAETGKTGLLSWENSVIKNRMDKKAWMAYRKLLTEAQVVEVDGRGSMRLNCQPWAAIELVKERC